MGALIRAFDWSSTPLGPLESWPQSLKTTVGMMIAAPNPMVLLWGWEGVLIYNDGYARFAGRRHPELLGKGAREGWPEIADFNDGIIRTVLGGGSISLKGQELVLDRAGTLEPGWMDLDYTPVPDETGKPAGVLVFVTEITDRMKAEQRASEETTRQRRMLQQMPGFTAILAGPEHRFEYVNNAYLDVSGGDRGFIGRNIREVFPELAGQGIYELLDRVYQTGERFVADDMRVRLARDDGERVLNFIYEPIRDEQHQIVGIFVGGYDITEGARAGSALKASQERYRTLFDNIDVGFCVIKVVFDENDRPVDYIFLEVNPAFATQTGLADVIGKRMLDLSPTHEQLWFDFYGKIVRTGEPGRIEYGASALARWWDVHAYRIGAPEDDIVAVLFSDITTRRHVEVRQTALIALNDTLRNLTDVREIAFAAAKILNGAMGGNRAVYATVGPDRETIFTDRDWSATGIDSIEGHLNLRDYGTFVGDLQRGEAVVIPDITADARTRDHLAAHKARHVKSFVIVPVIERGDLVATMSVSNAEPRQWMPDEVDFLLEVAERTRTAVERARANNALRNSESRLRALVTTTSTVLYRMSPDWSEMWSLDSAGFLQDTNASTGGWGDDYIPEDEKPRVNAAVQAAIAARSLFELEHRVRRADGTIGWTLSRAVPIFGADGEILEWFGAASDVSDRVAAQNARRESEARYEALFSAMDEGFCIIEFIDGPEGPLSDYVHIEANAAYAKNAGIPDVVGQKVRAMVGAEAQGWIDLYKGVLDTGQPIRFEKELEATQRWLELSAFRIEPKERNQVAVLFKDLTARKQAEQNLRDLNATLEQRVASALAERRLLADIIQSADAFVQVADTDLRWMAINEASAGEFERIYGIRPKVGDSMMEALAHLPDHASAVESVWRRAIAEAPFVEVQEFGDDRRDRRFYEMRFYPLLDDAGERIGAYQIVYDVTERLNGEARMREMEEVLRQSQKMEAVGQLTGGIAHDFNNLLGGISGSLELLEKRIADGRLEGVQRYITSAQEASRRAASLTQRLLAFSRRQTLDPKPVDANKLVAGMEDLIRRTVGPTIIVEVVQAGGLWPTRVDQSQLENSLLNLCINARDAMAPDGGRLTIETANKWLDERAARERELPPGQYISICVTDTGTGMPPDVIARVFDPFFTTKPMGQGTGLGLSMVYGFVRQSNGQVRIYSEVGKGTTMCLYLPRHFGAVDEMQEAPNDETIDKGAGETVLVIDDEPILRMLVIDVLEENGYRALEAIDGPSGLRVLESDTRIDLLVTDVGLPGGMNGRQVADAARRLRPDLKVLFITGYAENAVIGNGHLEPGMEVLTKPFPVSTLGQRIRDMIEKK